MKFVLQDRGDKTYAIFDEAMRLEGWSDNIVDATVFTGDLRGPGLISFTPVIHDASYQAVNHCRMVPVRITD